MDLSKVDIDGLSEALEVERKKLGEENSPPWRTSTFSEPGDWRWSLWRKGLYPPVLQVQWGDLSSPVAKIEFGTSEGEQFMLAIGGPGLGHLSLHLAHLPIPAWITHRTELFQSKLAGEDGEIHYNFVGLPRERQFALRLHLDDLAGLAGDHHLQVSIWDKAHVWESSQPWWQSFSISPLDWIFGPINYVSHPLVVEDREVEVGGFTYPVQVQVSQDEWKRSRWAPSHTVVRANIVTPNGHPGLPYLSRKRDRLTSAMSFPVPAQEGDRVDYVLRHVQGLMQTQFLRSTVVHAAASECRRIVNDLDPSMIDEPINWGDLDCVHVVLSPEGVLRVSIEEADSGALQLRTWVEEYLWDWVLDSPYASLVDSVEVGTEW